MSETPRTNQAMADVIDAGGTISSEHKSLVVLCRTLEAEVEALTADRDAWKAALVTERIKANIREAYPRGVGRSPYEPVGFKREATR